MESNDPPEASFSAQPSEPVVGDTVKLDASASSDPNGDNLNFQWSLETPENSSSSLSKKTGVETAFVADVPTNNGQFTVSLTVNDGNGGSENTEKTLTAKDNLPDEVRIGFENRATDGDSLIAGELSFAGQQVPEASGKKTGSFSVSGSRETKQLCYVENTFFNRNCVDVVPRQERSKTLKVERKQVTVAGTPKDSTGMIRSGSEITIFEPYRSDSVKTEGEFSIERPKRSGKREIVADLIIEDPRNSNRPDRYQASVSVAADESISRDILLTLLAACNDGISNDTDDLVDGDDPGCWNKQGKYMPDDDNEGHYLVEVVSISGGEGTEGTTVISSAEGERKYRYPDSDRTSSLPPSIVDAVQVEAGVETERDSTQADETFADTFKCGPTRDNLNNVNTSDIVADNQQQDGWALTTIPGIETDFFDTGRFCRIIHQHGTLVRGEPTGDGEDDVFFLKPDDTQRAYVIRFFVSEEDYEKHQNKSALYTKEGRSCRETKSGQSCTKVVTDGSGRY